MRRCVGFSVVETGGASIWVTGQRHGKHIGDEYDESRDARGAGGEWGNFGVFP